MIGPEFTYWHPNKSQNTVVTGEGGGTLAHAQRDQMGADVRVGYLVTPDFLVFGKGGYASSSQRETFFAPAGGTSFTSRGHADGYQYGGGVEYTLHDKFSSIPAACMSAHSMSARSTTITRPTITRWAASASGSNKHRILRICG